MIHQPCKLVLNHFPAIFSLIFLYHPFNSSLFHPFLFSHLPPYPAQSESRGSYFKGGIWRGRGHNSMITPQGNYKHLVDGGGVGFTLRDRVLLIRRWCLNFPRLRFPHWISSVSVPNLAPIGAADTSHLLVPTTQGRCSPCFNVCDQHDCILCSDGGPSQISSKVFS